MKEGAKDRKILYFYYARVTFVAKDIEILRKSYPLAEYHFNAARKWKIPFSFISQFIYLLLNIRKARIIACFFAGFHSFLPALFGRIFKVPVIIVLGGSDSYRYPLFQYGHFNKFFLGKCTCLSARLADLLLPVDDCLISSGSLYYNETDSLQGIRNFCHHLRTPYETVRLEYDPAFFYPEKQERRKSFITAAFSIEGTSFVRKGIDLIIETARQMPGHEFTILGCSREAVRVPVTDNVLFIPPVPYSELAEIYSQHRFYLQLSIAEGFPSAICEAMLCECVPVGSSVAALPFIIGDSGFILEKRDAGLLKAMLEEITAREDLHELGKKARQRIIDNFYPGSRSEKLYGIIERLTG